MLPEAYWKTNSFAVPALCDSEKQRVVKYKLGKGEVIWWRRLRH